VVENPPRKTNNTLAEKLEALLKLSEQEEAERYKKRNTPQTPPPVGNYWWNK
jgi:hypothetical protein